MMIEKYVSLVSEDGKAPTEYEVNLMINLLNKKEKWDNVKWTGREVQNWNYYPQSDNWMFIIYREYEEND